METASLAGRPVIADDLPFVSRVWNDERVAPTIGGVRAEQQLRDRMEQWTRHWNEHDFGTTLFQERTTRQPVAWGGLQHSTIGIGTCLTVGYVVAPEFWRRGYATEIVNASAALAFDVLGASQLYASVAATNAASRRVLEKAGLSVYSEIDHEGHIEVIYVIAR